MSATKVRVRCNWAQIMEGQIDSAHSSSLHSSDMVPAQVDGAKATDVNWLRPSTDKAPRFQIERTSYGFRYAAIRRPIVDEATQDYVRVTVYIAPFTALIPPNNVHNVPTLLIPEDDNSTMFYFIAWNGPDKPGVDADTWRKFNVLQWGVDVDAHFNNVRTADNLYRQDRSAMAAGNFTGISGIPNQDIAMWESMGPISDRSLRHWCRAIIFSSAKARSTSRSKAFRTAIGCNASRTVWTRCTRVSPMAAPGRIS